MNPILRKMALSAVIPAIAVTTLAGCKNSDTAAAASASASAHAFATSSQGQFDKAQAQQIMKKCAPTSPLSQLSWGKKMIEPKKGKATRDALTVCAGIPAAQKQAFENAALSATEKAVEAQVIHHQKGSITTLMEETLPNLVVKYRG